MVFAVESKVRLNLSGLKRLLKELEEANNTVAVSGVINGDANATDAAILNEFGGKSIYTDDPYRGEEVIVPARSFVQKPIDINAQKIIDAGVDELDFKKGSFIKSLNKMGKMASELQEKALETNGEGIPDWQKHNSPRTIDIKGFDKPLYTRHNTTFPIDYELQRRGA